MKERIKSTVLVVLVILNFILGSKVLSTKKLWSDFGYNFFSNSENPVTSFISSIKSKLFNKTPAETHLEAPGMIIINTGYQTTRLALNRSDEEFADLTPVINEFLTEAFSSPQKFVQAKSEDFYSALTAKSVYMRYSSNYDSSLFAYLLGISSADFSQVFSQLCNIVISADGTVYVEDSSTSDIYRCPTNISTQKLNAIIDSHATNEKQDAAIINYAFDLGFDKAFGTQKTVLAPIIPIYSDELELGLISAKNPLLKSDSTIKENEISNILRVFSMNPNILRRYTEADGTIVFVENNSVLKISSSGVIDYTATEGVILTKSSYSVQFDAISAIAGFVDNVNIASGSDSTMQLSSPLTASELSSGTLTVCLDYLAGGIPVKLNNPSFRNAVTLEIENGRIKKYRQLLRSYSPTDTTFVVPNYILALDDAIAKYESQLNDIEINTLEIVYEDDGTDGIKEPSWSVGVKDIIIAD